MIYPPLWDIKIERRVREAAFDMDAQKKSQPLKVVTCTRCVMTNQRPRIVFDEENVCSACRFHERKYKSIDWKARQDSLITVLSEKGSGFNVYDVIVPASGGKDSAFVATYLRDEFNLNVLCATWAPHIYTDIGRQNFDAMNHAGFDFVVGYPNGLLHRKLSRLSLEFYGDPFLPFVFGQMAWPIHVAKQNGVNLVFFGENGEAEYGGDPSANNKHGWDYEDWERVYQKGASLKKLLDLGLDLGAITVRESLAYSPFYTIENKPPMPEHHWLSYYTPWHPEANYYHATDKTGFSAAEERQCGTFTKYASLDDKLDHLHYFLMYLKFGIGRCTSDAAQQVRNGELEREEALSLVARYDGEYPTKHLTECLNYLGMTMSGLHECFDRYNRAGVDYD